MTQKGSDAEMRCPNLFVFVVVGSLRNGVAHKARA